MNDNTFRTECVMEAIGWIEGSENAKEMLSRLLRDRPFFLLPPPLHRLPFRVGNVVELVGPSPSAKTHILMEAAIACVLPKHYGGQGHPVVFLDLDCRFDISRLSHLLKLRLSRFETGNADVGFDVECFAECMRRFLYVRCYHSLQFLATLKTLHYQLEKVRKSQGSSAHLLMVDSIGAFHWTDRASTSLPLTGNNRKSFSLQNVSETVVQEIKKLLLVHPMLVIATKATILGDRYAANGKKWNPKRWNSPDTSMSRSVTKNADQLVHREYMSSVWQSFVTHRILVRDTDDHTSISKHNKHSVYMLEWLFPSLSFEDKFMVGAAGIFCIS